MPPPAGSYGINADGNLGTLTVGLDGMGGISSTVFGQPPVGFFNETSRTFTFLPAMSSDLSTFEVYTGSLFQFSPGPNTVTYMHAGNFQRNFDDGSMPPLSCGSSWRGYLRANRGRSTLSPSLPYERRLFPAAKIEP
jgi:hypothetical protein